MHNPVNFNFFFKLKNKHLGGWIWSVNKQMI